MSEDAKFPEPIDIMYQPFSPLFMPEHYWMKSADDWFRRCIEDYPKYPNGLEDKTLQDVIMERHTWFMRWFIQFMKSENIE